MVWAKNRAVGTIKEFDAVMKDLLERQPKIVKIFVQRGPRTHFIFIEPVWSEIVQSTE